MRLLRVPAALALLGLAAPSPAQNAPPTPWRAKEQPNFAELAAKAPALDEESVGAPVRSARLSGTYLAPNPDGKTWDLVQIYFKQYGGPNTILLIDLATGKVKQEETARGYNFHLAPAVIAPNGKLFINILGERGRQEVCIYDPSKDEFRLNAVKMPPDIGGETHPMVLGPDGMLYCAGGNPDKAVTVVQVDPQTERVRSYGSIGPSHAPSDCWAYSMVADERYVYVASGKVPWYLVALDRQTGKWETLATTEKVDGYVSLGRGPKGQCASASITRAIGDASGEKKTYWLVDGKLVPMKDPNEAPPKTLPTPPRAVPLPPRPEISTAAATPGVDGAATLWVRPGKDPADEAAKDGGGKPESGRARTSGGEKGAEEAAEGAPPEVPDDASMEAQGWKPFRFKVAIYPMAIYRLRELPDGRLVGTAGSYEGNFLYDPKTGKSEHPGKVHLSQYATVVHDGKVWMSGYPSSPVYVYDPAKPWTAGQRIGGTKVMEDGAPGSNPRRLAYLKDSGAHKMYAAVAANGRIWFGGRWYRTGAAGAVGWYDPRDGSSGGFWQPFSNYQVNYMTSADDGKLLVVSAHRIDDTLLNKPKPEQGALFFLETASAKLVGDKLEVVPKAKGPGPVLGVGGARVIGWTENPADENASVLYGVDAVARKVEWTKPLPFPLPVRIGGNQQDRWDFRLGPDGRVWTFMGKGDTLVRIDPADGSVEVLGRLKSGGPLAFSGNDLYLGGSEELRRVKGVLRP
jgi:hypothetical protein